MIVFICGKCGKRLQVADEVAGKKCRCPGCSTVNNVPASAASKPTTPGAPAPQSSLMDILNSSNSNNSNSGGYWNGVETSSPPTARSNPYAAPSYQSQPQAQQQLQQPQYPYLSNYGGLPEANPLGLVMGILSLCMPLAVCFTYGFSSLFGLVMGIIAWIAASNERKKAAQGLVRGGTAEVGYVLGIIGTIINALIVLLIAGFIIVFIFAAANGQLNQRT